MPELTQKILQENLFYDPATGIFTRIKHFRCRLRPGPAGCVFKDGYRHIQAVGIRRTASHLAWLYMYGEFPSGFLDHINGIRDDNRIANLRIATPLENSQNQRIPKHNTSGVVGVRWNEKVNKWSAQISVKSKNIFLGYFLIKEEAISARIKAKEKYHEFSPFVRENN